MSEQIFIEKTVYSKNNFGKIINTQFNQLLNQQEEEIPVFTIENFFELYDQLFYQIPKEGDSNSHRFIIEKEAEYLGIIISQEDIQALLDEITTLRQQLIDTQTALDEISKTVKK